MQILRTACRGVVGCEENGERDEEEVGAQCGSWRFMGANQRVELRNCPFKPLALTNLGYGVM